MKVHESVGFKGDLKLLPHRIQKKFLKQIKLLVTHFFYPSLHTKKIQGQENVWEARVDLQYRFRFEKLEDDIYLISMGPHDEGLGKK